MAKKDFNIFVCSRSVIVSWAEWINLFQAKLSIEENQFINDLMGKSFAKLMKLKLEIFNKNNSAEIVNRLYHDAEMAGMIVTVISSVLLAMQ